MPSFNALRSIGNREEMRIYYQDRLSRGNFKALMKVGKMAPWVSTLSKQA